MNFKLEPKMGFSKRRLASAITIALAGYASGEVWAALPVSNACVSAAGIATCSLWAKSGTTSVPGNPSLPVWGLTDTDTGLVTQPGGPVLVVNQGDVVTLHFTNNLGVPTMLHFPGQAGVPDLVQVAIGGTHDYTFTAGQPGTYLYEAAPEPGQQYQSAMGLYGAIVVRPTASTTCTLSTLLQAYCDVAVVAPAVQPSNYTEEALLVLSEVDPALTGSVDPSAFDLRTYAPKYSFINGKVFPSTDPVNVTFGTEQKVLLRYVNAGLKHHPMAVLGQRQTGIARDGSALTNVFPVVGETIAPGATWDAVVTVPATAPAGSKFAVYDSNLKLMNSNQAGFGGILTFIADGSTLAWPKVQGLALTPNWFDVATPPASVGISATVKSDPTVVTDSVSAAEFFIDAPGTDGSGCPLTGAFNVTTVAVTGSITSGACALPTVAGNHAVYVHGQKTDGTNLTWGPYTSTTLRVTQATVAVDATGPVTSGVSLAPTPTNGSVDVALSATGNDTLTGNHNVTAAQYAIDGGTGAAMTVAPIAPIASLTATIPAATVGALSEGIHSVAVSSQDSIGNTGAPVAVELKIDKTGPLTSNLVIGPNPTNGKVGYNANTPAVRISAALADQLVSGVQSGVAGAEGFIDTAPANVNTRGFSFASADGQFNAATENAYGDIPLTTISQLSNGSHTLIVRAKDASGNWGANSSVAFTVDKLAPTFTGFTPAGTTVATRPTIALGTATLNLTITGATDGTGTGLAGGDYWLDGSTVPPAATIAFTGTAPVIDTSALTAGVHTIRVRIKDVVGNFSAVKSLTLYVLGAVNDTARGITATATTAATNQTGTLQVPPASNTSLNLLTNDEPLTIAGRTVTNVSAVTRTAGPVTGVTPGTLGVTCVAAGTCTYTLTPAVVPAPLPAGFTAATYRQASKRGTYTFTYTERLNGVTSAPAMVTVTVN